jgi:hypothetical protein
MDYFYFCLSLTHVLAGLLFVGLPVMAWAGAWYHGQGGWPLWREGLQQAVLAGLVTLVLGLLMAGFRWDDSFDQAWETVGNRWLFAFAEFAFSLGLIAGVAYFAPQWPAGRGAQRWVLGLLFLAATNALYHFPSLMIVSREVRTRPDLVVGLDGAVVRQLLFSPEILLRWLHVAIAGLMCGAVWFRFLLGLQVDAQKRDRAPRHRDDANAEFAVEISPADWVIRWGVWLPLLGLWLSGFCLLLNMDTARLEGLIAVGSGRSNNLMIGVVAATAVGIRVLFRDSEPSGLGRFLEVGLMIMAATAMLGL